MARNPTLTYDRGTLILHPPPRGKDWLDFATWDDRIEKFRIPAIDYRGLKDAIANSDPRLIDKAKAYQKLELTSALGMTPYPHQQEALAAWQAANKQGVVVLPTAAGKTYLAQMAIQATQRSTLIIVPTLDLMHQWYAQLEATFPNTEVGLLGGGSRDRTPLLVATYNSAAIQAEHLGNLYGLMVFDECHHLPSDFHRVIAEGAISPYRLGLTATPDRSDGRHEDLTQLIGPEIYRKSPEELSGLALAQHETVQIQVKLSKQERQQYEKLTHLRNQFLQDAGIYLGSLQGWQNFVRQSAQSTAGRRAMRAHRQARALAFGTEGKLRVLEDLLAQHHQQQTLIFTDDNATVYRISQDFLIPAITHQTPVKERHDILLRFRSGEYPRIVASRVLNEGVDVPAASVAIVLSGTGSAREHIQRLGRILRKGKDPSKLARLYEVIAEDTSEENTSRRRQSTKRKKQPLQTVLPLRPHNRQQAPRAADTPGSSSPYSSSDE